MSQRSKTLIKYREMEPLGLEKEEAELRTAIWKTKVQKGMGQISDPLRLSAVRKDLARLLTVRREREAKAAGGAR